MNRHINILKVLSLGLILIFPVSSFSATEAGETVTKRGTLNDDYYAAGGTVDIDAEIAGDLVVAGGDLFIGHSVQHDVMATGGAIRVSGEILDDVRAAGGEINIDATIGDDLFSVGGEIRVSPTTSIGGEAWLAGGDVQMAGTISNGLSIAAGNIRISGTIYGDVELEGGEIEILEGALIEGNLHYKSPNEAKIDPGAKITGDISYEQKECCRPHRGFSFFFLITLIVSGIVLFLLFPGFTMSSVGRISADPWKSLGVGFALLVVTPIAAILLMVTVLGLWIGLTLLALYFVALFIGFLIACFLLGDWGASRLQKDVSTTGRRLLSLSIAIILLGLIQPITVIGGLLSFLLLLLGLGAGIVQLHSVYSQS